MRLEFDEKYSIEADGARIDGDGVLRVSKGGKVYDVAISLEGRWVVDHNWEHPEDQLNFLKKYRHLEIR